MGLKFGIRCLAIMEYRAKAWMCWSTNQPLSLVDKSVSGNFSIEEVTTCIHIGLLCVQEEVARRPTMSRILNVLNGNSTINLPEPAPPLLPQHTGLEVVGSGSTPSKSTHIIDVCSSSQDISKYSGTRKFQMCYLDKIFVLYIIERNI